MEAVLLSRNSPDLSLRDFNSIQSYGLGIKTGSFMSGRLNGPEAAAWAIDLFLSNKDDDVRAAVEASVSSSLPLVLIRDTRRWQIAAVG